MQSICKRVLTVTAKVLEFAKNNTPPTTGYRTEHTSAYLMAAKADCQTLPLKLLAIVLGQLYADTAKPGLTACLQTNNT